MSLRQKSTHANGVLIAVNSDGTVTATFLGRPILKKQTTPLPVESAKKAYQTVVDNTQRSKFCTKHGVTEAYANEAVEKGAGTQFVKDLKPYVDKNDWPVVFASPEHTPLQSPKKKVSTGKRGRPPKKASAKAEPAQAEAAEAQTAEAETAESEAKPAATKKKPAKQAESPKKAIVKASPAKLRVAIPKKAEAAPEDAAAADATTD